MASEIVSTENAAVLILSIDIPTYVFTQSPNMNINNPEGYLCFQNGDIKFK